MGIFSFIQRKLEDSVLMGLHERLISKYFFWYVSVGTVDCHKGFGGRHKSLVCPIPNGSFSVHYCDSVGYASIKVDNEEHSWVPVNWVNADIRQSADAYAQFYIDQGWSGNKYRFKE